MNLERARGDKRPAAPARRGCFAAALAAATPPQVQKGNRHDDANDA